MGSVVDDVGVVRLQEPGGRFIDFVLRYRRDDKTWFFLCPLCEEARDVVDDKMNARQKAFYFKPESTESLSMSRAFGKLKRHIRTSHKFVYTVDRR